LVPARGPAGDGARAQAGRMGSRGAVPPGRALRRGARAARRGAPRRRARAGRARRGDRPRGPAAPAMLTLRTEVGAIEWIEDAALAAGAAEPSVPARPVDDPAIRILGEASRRAGRLTLVQPERSSPFVATEGDFGDYLGGLSRKERRDLDRRRRKLEAEHRAS